MYIRVSHMCACNCGATHERAPACSLAGQQKQQKKRRLSRKVNRVEPRRYPSLKTIHFCGHQGYLFLFLRKRRRVSWQPAWVQPDTSSADIWRRAPSTGVNKVTEQLSLKSFSVGSKGLFFLFLRGHKKDLLRFVTKKKKEYLNFFSNLKTKTKS